jgi:hypothetical protein
MFIYSFIGCPKITYCNCIAFLFNGIGISFAFSKLSENFVLIKSRKGGRKMPEIFRRFPERRTGKDRRKIFSRHRLFYKGLERRKAPGERRSQDERRDGWVRTQKWSSVNLQDLKIAKYLK